LPQVGSGLAKDIVAFREQSKERRPFRRAADLEEVPGIGPKTVHRLAKYLRFDEQSENP
jgi:DNA uptake protein ComE-like DNA-binding protein